MKVIAKTKDGYLVDISSKEIDSLLALTDDRKSKNRGNNRAEYDFVGAEIGIGVALNNLDVLKTIDLENILYHLKNTRLEAEKLEKLIEGLKPELQAEKDKITKNQQ
jgi:hypothetical protein